MAQKALGRSFNAVLNGSGKWISLKDASEITFLCFLTGGVGETYTLQEAKDAGGTGAQNLAIITEYYTNTGDGSDAWTRRTQNAAATVTTAAASTQNAAVIEVLGTSLDDGYKYVKLTATGSGRVTPVVADLKTQRAAANLTALGV